MTAEKRSKAGVATRIGVVLVLVLLWGFAGSDRTPASLSSAAHAAETDFLSKAAHDTKPEHDLSALKIFNRVVILVKDNYVDPKRVDPKKMMVAALDMVEQTVPEVMADGDEKSPKLRVTVNKASKDFDITQVDSLWRMSFALKEVFDFINKNLVSRDDTRDIEYAAVNGMLKTLDPHSILLKPEYFKEMKLQTKGEFGGVGFVIQMKEGNLTVVKVMKGTPASKVGIKAKDQIVKIGNESTVNMDLNEAVSRLRGKPGTELTITVLRSGWQKPKDFTVTRAIINVESVESKLLANNVAYIRLKGFQGNTHRDMLTQLRKLRAEAQKNGEEGGKLKGLVLDLRGNPGGLLEQAIQISDTFVEEGTIVTTVGYSDKLREVKKAHAEDTEKDLPIAVLVNSGSASASEIVSGALKNLNRAVIIGRQTFGKGSVQVLYDFPDESALKLTIAQYLTPGDISIQEVGITPDIQLIPSRVQKERVDVFAPKKLMGEADLDRHFGNAFSEKAVTKREEVVAREKPLEEIRYLREEPQPKKDEVAKKDRPDRDDYEMEEEDVDPDEEDVVEDFQIKFARDLLLAAPANNRKQMLEKSKGFIAERRKAEEEKIKKAIEELGVDWSAAPANATGGAKLSVDMKPASTQKTQAGDKLAWTVTVENTGTAPTARLRAYSDSENPFLDRREFLFGKVNPGEKKSWTVTVKLPKELPSRTDPVTLKFTDDAKSKVDDFKGEVAIVELPRPGFAYSWQLVDRCEKCNGDGIPQLGETLEMVVDVRNMGQGKAYDAVAVIKNKSDENIFIHKGRSKLGEIAPGASKAAAFEFEVLPGYKDDTFQLQLTMGDEQLDEYVSEKIDVPIAANAVEGQKPALAAVKTSQDSTPVFPAAAAGQPMAQVKKGAVLPVEAKLGDFYRVKLPGNRVGFVAAKEVKETKPEPKAAAPAIDMVEMRSEPQIVLAVDPSQGGIETDADKFSLVGSAIDQQKVRDLYIFVNEQKVFYKSGEGATEVKFQSELPLKVGINNVLVIAREGTEVMGQRRLVVHRRSAELAQKAQKVGAPAQTAPTVMKMPPALPPSPLPPSPLPAQPTSSLDRFSGEKQVNAAKPDAQ